MKNIRVIFFKLIFFLSILLASALILYSQEKKQDKESTGQMDYSNEEDIHSPDEYEDWVEPDDEQIYKFEINQITPKGGQCCGLLIYYGHLIVLPYQVEIRDIINDWSIFINNIPFDLPPKEFTEKYSKRREARINQSLLTLEEKKSSEEWKLLFKEIKRRMLEIRLKYVDKEKEDEEIKKYLANHPKIIDFRYRTYNSFDIKPKIKGYEDSFIIIAGSSQPPKTDEEVLKDHIEKLNNDKKAYEYKISNNDIYFTLGGVYSYFTKDKLDELCKIKNTPMQIKTKLIHIYKSFDLFHLSAVKLLYYNFDCDTFYKVIKVYEK